MTLDQLLARGCALIVGFVTSGGEPYATRGWGLTPVAGSTGRFRLVLSGDDAPFVAADEDGWAVAVTVGDPRTSRSLQLKGRADDIGPAEDADLEASADYCEAFFQAVSDADGRPRSLLEGMRPPDLAACTLTVSEVFDQTPGPAAGSSLGWGS